jgi:hypothetical protein
MRATLVMFFLSTISNRTVRLRLQTITIAYEFCRHMADVVLIPHRLFGTVTALSIVCAFAATIGVGCGSSNGIGNKATSGQSAIDRIRVLGGRLKGSEEPLLAKHVYKIDFSGGNVLDDDLVLLQEFENLEYLNLQGTKVTNAGLSQVGKLTRLKDLCLGNCEISDKGLEKLQSLVNLECLELGSTSITGSGLKSLKDMKKLTILYLSNNKLQEGSLESLGELAALEVIDLDSTPLHDSDLESLFKCIKLRKVLLRDTKVSEGGIEDLKVHLPKTHVRK